MDPVEAAARRAEVLLDLERPAAAEAMLGEVLAADPGHREALALLVRCQLTTERYESAAATARRLLAAHPDDGHGLRGLALAHLGGADPETIAAPARREVVAGMPARMVAAELVARRAVAVEPDDVDGLLVLARVLAALPGGLAEALGVLDRAERVAPGTPEPWVVRAQLLAAEEDWAGSERAARAALAVDPADPSTRLLLAAVRAMRGDLRDYHRDTTDALHDRHDPEVLRLLVTLAEALDLPDEMLPTYRAARAALGRPDAGTPQADLVVLYGAAVSRLGEALTDAAGDASGSEPVEADLDDVIVRADRVLALGELLDDRSLLAPVAEVFQDILDGATGTPPADLVRVTERAHHLLTTGPATRGAGR